MHRTAPRPARRAHARDGGREVVYCLCSGNMQTGPDNHAGHLPLF